MSRIANVRVRLISRTDFSDGTPPNCFLISTHCLRLPTGTSMVMVDCLLASTRLACFHWPCTQAMVRSALWPSRSSMVVASPDTLSVKLFGASRP